MKINIKRKLLWVTLLWFAAWHFISIYISKPLLLPGPLQTFTALTELAASNDFWLSVGATILRVISGFTFALIIGTLFGTVCVISRFADRLFSPVKSVIKTTPVSSFIILVLLWLPVNITPVFIAFLMAVPVFWINIMEGIQKTDRQLIEMADVYRFGFKKKLQYIIIPSVLPYFSAAFSTAFGFSWKAGIAAEVIAKPRLSIGTNLQNAKVYLETDRLFAWTFIVIVLSFVIEKLLLKCIKLMISAKGEAVSDMH